MDETVPRCVEGIDPAYPTLWRIKGGENITVKYLSSSWMETLDGLFHQECRTYRNNVREHRLKESGIVRVAFSGDHMIGGVLYDTYVQRESIIVLRDIAVLRAWQRNRVGTALLESIIMFHQKNCPRGFDMFMCVGKDDFEMQGFLQANGFDHSRDEREQCTCEGDQLLRKRSIVAPRTVEQAGKRK